MEENAEKGIRNLDLSSLLGAMLSNPEMLSKIGNIISKIGNTETSTNSPPTSNNAENIETVTTPNKENSNNFEASSPTFQNHNNENIVSKLPDILSKISSSNADISAENKQQIALLLAIRPYLSEHRKELIDTFIKMNRLGSIFKNLT